VRLWVSLVRYDAGGTGELDGLLPLPAYPNLWNYARDLYQLPAFHDTTDFSAFTPPGAQPSDWSHTPRLSLVSDLDLERSTSR
jgi:putative glutathione S-transferase